jgi:O-antigen ligase
MYHLALALFATVCIVTSLVCLVSTFYTNHINGMAYSAATSWMYSSENLTKDFGFHPSYLATFCSTSIFILIYFCRQKLLGLLPTVVGALYLFAFIFLLASRIGLLALLAVLSLTILYETYRRNRMLLGLFLTTTLLLAVATGIYFSDTAREKFYAMVGYNIHEYNAAFQVHRRYAIWGSALTLIQENPVLGVGIGDMREDLAVAHSRTGFEEGHEQLYNAHNLFLETAAATGIVSLIVLLALLFLSARHALRHNNMLHLQFLLLFLCISMVESTLSVQKGIVFFSFMNALFIAAGTLSISERVHAPNRSQATPA